MAQDSAAKPIPPVSGPVSTPPSTAPLASPSASGPTPAPLQASGMPPPAKPVSSQKVKKAKKEKKLKPPKPKKIPRSFHERLAALMPEHLGDIVFLLLVVSLFVGGTLLWMLAWIPTHVAVDENVAKSIPFFVDEELERITDILDARTEASTAPVIPPTRDPFK